MPNMDPKKCPMPSQEPNVRNKNFKEVALGYTEEMAVNEAKRCLQCKNHPCRSGCPVEIDIPGFIKHVAEGDFEAAYNVIAQSSALPAVCGRVCPQEHQCEGKCVRGIKGEAVGIGRLERFVADWHRNNVHPKPVVPASNGHMAAVFARFRNKPSLDEIKAAWAGFQGRAQELALPSAPKQFLHYFEEPDRPQTRLDRMTEGGMAVCIGRLRPDTQYDYKFVCLSHNTLRGAAGGAVLLAELLCAEGYIQRR